MELREGAEGWARAHPDPRVGRLLGGSLYCLLLGEFVCLLWLMGALPDPQASRLTRHCLREICASVRPGMSPGEVRGAIGHHLDPRVDLRLECSDRNEWSVTSPVEFGAKNWVLYLRFRRDKLAGVAVRTYDSKGEVPWDDPPQDMGAVERLHSRPAGPRWDARARGSRNQISGVDLLASGGVRGPRALRSNCKS